MTTDDLISYFGSGARAARALGLHRNTFSNWVKRGQVSLDAQIKYNRMTYGVLKITLKGDCHDSHAL